MYAPSSRSDHTIKANVSQLSPTRWSYFVAHTRGAGIGADGTSRDRWKLDAQLADGLVLGLAVGNQEGFRPHRGAP